MQIEKNKVVGIDYTLTDDQGQVLDSSEGLEPLCYLHGADNIIPGLERALEGQEVGAELEVLVTSEDGYGDRDESLIQEISKEEFNEIENLEVGMEFEVETDEGPLVISITEIGDEVVTVDGNHPLAGMNLSFKVAVREIRKATEEELEHGHAHGPGDDPH